MENQSNIKLIRNLLSIITTVIAVIVLKEMAFVIIPLAMSIFLAALFVPTFMRLKKWKFPNFIAIFMVGAAIIGSVRVGGFIIQLTNYEYSLKKNEINSLVDTKLLPTFESIGDYTGIDLGKDIDWSKFSDALSSGKFMDSVSPILDMFNSVVGMYLMILIYLIIILASIYNYEKYLRYLGGEKQGDGLLKVVNNWIDDLRIYIKVKTLVSLVTGILFGGLCYLFGVDFALFFGFLAFVLNFIPQLGSLIATVFPVLLAFLEINSLPMVGLFAALLMAVQLIMGTFIEVKYIGKSFAMSTLVVFVNLVFWGYLWGVAGVILSVPIIILFKNIANHIDENSMIARLFSSEK
ncbi:AI-2E family transporter [Flavobacteriales bacterium]|nr:AI-2E family transporter [Flavobacteriales bacterium]